MRTSPTCRSSASTSPSTIHRGPPSTACRRSAFKKSDDIGKFTAFIEGGSTKFKYRYVVNYKGESRVFTSKEFEFEGNDLKINVDELGLWLVDVEVGDMNFEQVARAVLTLEHPQLEPGVPPVSRFQIDKDNRKFAVKELLLRPALPYTASLKYFMKDGREYVRTLADQKGQRFYVDDPFSATRAYSYGRAAISSAASTRSSSTSRTTTT